MSCSFLSLFHCFVWINEEKEGFPVSYLEWKTVKWKDRVFLQIPSFLTKKKDERIIMFFFSYHLWHKSISWNSLIHSPSLRIYGVGRGLAGLAGALLLWPVITEQLHWKNNVHQGTDYSCPTAKTGLIGGGAFVSLDATLFWLVSLMLASNTREDYFGEIDTPLEQNSSNLAAFDEPIKGVGGLA